VALGALAGIVIGGVLMSAIALVGSATLLLSPAALARIVSPLVAFAAGSLLGGAFFHMLPAAAALAAPDLLPVFAWTLAGFGVFLALEQLLHRHHCSRAGAECRKPLGILILIGDGLHNLLGGMGVAAAFLTDVRVGVMTWLAAAAHEVPQELGDFAVLIHAGFGRRAALVANFLSGLTFLAGGLLAYTASELFEPGWLLPFAAGNFLYIGASDLVPEINRQRSAPTAALHLLAFAAGAGLLWLLRVALET
jgi:zinc and cadmium transporter